MKTLVLLFTYNEVENIKILIPQILSLGEYLDVVVVDDNSPDGTSEKVEKLKKYSDKVHLITRYKKKGRGEAGKRGFQYAITTEADYIIEMDADLSHNPKYIPFFLDAIQHNDIVIGSRKIKGGRDKRNSLLRKQITNMAGMLIKKVLNGKITDPTSGYRCFRREVLEDIGLDSLHSKGPFILTEILYKCIKKGYTIGEIPIEYDLRREGNTKLNIFIILNYLIKLVALKISDYKNKMQS